MKTLVVVAILVLSMVVCTHATQVYRVTYWEADQKVVVCYTLKDNGLFSDDDGRWGYWTEGGGFFILKYPYQFSLIWYKNNGLYLFEGKPWDTFHVKHRKKGVCE